MTRQETFITKSKLIHGNRYDYSKVEYTNNKDKVIITCDKHGDFHQIPSNHTRGKGCWSCRNEYNSIRKTSTADKFVSKAIAIHGDLYVYDDISYVNSSTKIDIKCKIHGFFSQTPNSHLMGRGCPDCAMIIRRKTLLKSSDDFVSDAKKRHGDKYDYSRSDYSSVRDYVTIICPTHGEFQQIADYHLSGSGCSKCGAITPRIFC